MICSKCGAQIADSAKFCRKCGSKIELNSGSSAAMICDYCGNTLDGDSVYCPVCGRRVIVEPSLAHKPPRKNKRGRLLLLSLAVLFVVCAFCICGLFYRGILPWGDGLPEEINMGDSDSDEEMELYYQPFSDENVVYENGRLYVDSQLLLTAVRGTSKETVEALAASEGGEIVGFISISDDYQIEFSQGKTYDELCGIAEGWSHECFVEDVSLHDAFEEDSASVSYRDDPWRETGNNDNSGSEWSEAKPGGLNWWAEVVRLPSVWDRDDVSYDTVNVGIFDSMFQTDHPDLDGLFVKTWQNPVKITDSHGTLVAGLIAAKDDMYGIVGASQNAHLYGFAREGEDAKQYGTLMKWKYAIALFLTNGVKVMNFSCGWDQLSVCASLDATNGLTKDNSIAISTLSLFNKVMEQFLLKCLEKYDFIIVKSAGNDRVEHWRQDPDKDPARELCYYYDDNGGTRYIDLSAEYQLFAGIESAQVRNRIITVGSVDLKYKKGIPCCELSDFSEINADVCAPGGGATIETFWTIDYYEILSDGFKNETSENVVFQDNGTSMSAPIVSGIAALVWGINPALTGEEVCTILMNSPMEGMYRDAEVVDANAAVNAALRTRIDNPGQEPEITTGTLMGYIAETETAAPDSIAVYSEDRNTKVCDLALQESYSFVEFLEPGNYVLRIDGFDDIAFAIQQREVTYLVVDKPAAAAEGNAPRYQVIDTSMTWTEARVRCEEMGGHLVVITSEEEQRMIESLLPSGNLENYWIGGYFASGDGWRWVTGEPFDYQNWDVSQPDNQYGNEYYLRLVNKDIAYSDWNATFGKWDDTANDADGDAGDAPLSSFGFICEWEDSESNKTQEADVTPNVPVEQLYHMFIDNEEYSNYLKDGMWEVFPVSGYAIFDVDQDGIPELFLETADDGYGFYSFALFTYNPDTAQVVFLSDHQAFAEIYYAAGYKAFVYSEIRPSATYSQCGFWTIENYQTTFLFSVTVTEEMIGDKLQTSYYVDGPGISEQEPEYGGTPTEDLEIIEFVSLTENG